MDSPSVGEQLLDVPFGEMIESMAIAIADSQLALDLNSIQTTTTLAETVLPEGSVVVAIKETQDEDGNVTESELVFNPNPMPLLVYGIQPTFYSFSESHIEVKMAITMKQSRDITIDIGANLGIETSREVDKNKGPGILKSIFGRKKTKKVTKKSTTTFSTTFNASYSNKYSFEASGTSCLRTTLRPVEPPSRAIPRLTVVEPDGQ